MGTATRPTVPRDRPECGGQDLRVAVTRSGSGYGPRLLPGLGTWFLDAPMTVVVCRACGLVRLFAQPAALEKLDGSSAWQPVPPAGA